MNINTRALRITASLIAIAGMTAALGNACSQLQSAGSSGLSAASTGATCTATTVAAFTPVSGAQTLGVEYGTDGTASGVVQNMVACTGLSLTNLSQTTINDITARSSSFASTSYIGNIQAAMMMAVAAVGFDVCGDLVTAESAMPAASRNFFNTFDFTGSTTVPMASVDDALNRLARSCWGRAPTQTETTLAEQAMTALNSSPQIDGIGICGAVLASFSGVTQ
jgi:hypothetical protein